MLPSTQRYSAPSDDSASSDSDSNSDSDSAPSSRRAPHRHHEEKDNSEGDDSVDELGRIEDEEKVVGLRGDGESQRPPDLKGRRRRWLMASLPTNNSASSAPPPPPPPKSWFSGLRLVYLVLTLLVVLAIITFGSVLIYREYDAEEDPATSGSNSLSTPSGALSPPEPEPEPTTGVFQRFPELRALMEGNRAFREEEEEEHPGLIAQLAQGQHPKFAYLGCSDSRTPETTLFHALPGDLFVTRNVGNQYLIDDLSSETVMSYAIAHLAVQHLVVMGHYGCGAVQVAMSEEAQDAETDIGSARIEAWIRPLRMLFQTSNHSDVVAFRSAYKEADTIPPPNRTNPAFRALVEENVKQQVLNLADDSSVLKSWKTWFDSESGPTSTSATSQVATANIAAMSNAAPAPTTNGTSAAHNIVKKRSAEKPVELFLHGFVYDIDTGLVSDLGVSVGPSGPIRR